MARFMIVVAVVAYLAGSPAPAAANPTGWNALALVTVTKSVPLKEGGIKTVTAKCPRGLTPLTGGAFVFEEGHGPAPAQAAVTRLVASFPSTKGWTASAYNLGGPADLDLEAVAQCGGFQNQFVKASLVISPGVSFSTTVGCPTQDGFTENAYGAGGYLSGLKTAIASDSGITETILDNIPWRWTVGAENRGQKDVQLNLVAVCAGFTLDYENVQIVTQSGIAPGATAGGNIQCPAGSHAMAGSAAFINGSSNAMTGFTALASSSMTVDSSGWYFAALNRGFAAADFKAFVYCLKDD
jgi:hypothetical protein